MVTPTLVPALMAPQPRLVLNCPMELVPIVLTTVMWGGKPGGFIHPLPLSMLPTTLVTFVPTVRYRWTIT